jgi:hypothetical protein
VLGLDECKYQWAIDRYKMMQAMQQQVGRATQGGMLHTVQHMALLTSLMSCM